MLCFVWQVAVKTLPFYNKYFDIAYPLQKMKKIAIADFAAGILADFFILNLIYVVELYCIHQLTPVFYCLKADII